MNIGKSIRMERIMNRNTKRSVIIPMDHSVGDGPIKGLIDTGETVDKVAKGGANAVIGHVGLPLHGHRKHGKDVGLILHLSASTAISPDPNNKVLVNSVQNAIKMGADAVSVHINLGATTEFRMLKDLGDVAQECMEWGMPLLAMMYPRGPEIKNPADVKNVKIAARCAAEIGADIVKVPYTGSPETFKEVTEGCPIPVVIAGGSKGTAKDTLKMVEDAIKAGGGGVAMGRNAFQCEDPTKLVKAVTKIVHYNKTAEEAMKDVGL
ncbi:2-amino-3,7-dideoxy-D-threo-hept-6-ulosonate synthase [Nanoarchaeota archaeon]